MTQAQRELPRLRLVAKDALNASAKPDVVVAGSHPGNDAAVVTPRIADFAAGQGVQLERRLKRLNATGNAGEIQVVDLEGADDAPAQLLIAGLGEATTDDFRVAGACVGRKVGNHRRVVVDLTADADAAGLRAFVEGFLLARYSFSLKSAPRKVAALHVDLVIGNDVPKAQLRRALDAGRTTAQAVWTARDLGNTPSNEKSPQWLADRAVELAEAHGLGVTVRSEKVLAREGFGGIIAVGQGSTQPPRLVELTYVPAKVREGSPHVVMVGKGITFDSGGLSLKPPEGMTTMKTDMAGAAAVLGVMASLADLKVGVRVTALLALAENMPSGSSFRPGDVVTHYGGTTSEIRNTDAEGRLVLADALAYADAKLDPDVVIDVATLTGAASLGLGRQYGALYASQDDLATALLEASDASGELLWQMPLVEDYTAALHSDLADLSHTDQGGHRGGSITAALFLREFAGDRSWAHLDIAGPARSDSDNRDVSRGATGYATRTLARYLELLG